MKLEIEIKHGDKTLTREFSESETTAFKVYFERAADMEIMLDHEDAGLSGQDAEATIDFEHDVWSFLVDADKANRGTDPNTGEPVDIDWDAVEREFFAACGDPSKIHYFTDDEAGR